MTEMGEFGPGQDWDARAHVRLLRTNGGASSGYTADLIERLYTELIAAALASRPSQGGEWVMVPMEPTLDMQNAGWADVRSQGLDPEEIEVGSIYTTMLSASPSPYGVEELVERAFRDGLAYGSNVEGADPDIAWQHSRARLLLKEGGE